jgi:tRNA G18 (ribose-2'-O)-methylase SpoU
LSRAARERVAAVLSIPQFGSTRSINAGAASAVAMYEWCRRHAAEESGGRPAPAVTAGAALR